MGVTGFGSFLRSKAPHVFKPIAADAFVAKRVAIDMTHKVHEAFHACRSVEAATLADLSAFMSALKTMGVLCTFVFDGDTRNLKRRAHDARRAALHSAQRRIVSLKQEVCTVDAMLTAAIHTSCAVPEPEPEPVPVPVPAETASQTLPTPEKPVAPETPEDATASLCVRRRELHGMLVKLEERVQRPSSKLFSSVRTLLTAHWGADAVLTAPDDAEKLVAQLCADGKVDFAASTDYDTLFFGSKNVVLYFMHPEKMRVLHLEDVCAALKLTYAQLVDLAILCGCDMVAKAPGVGPVTALKLLQTEGSIEGARARLTTLGSKRAGKRTREDDDASPTSAALEDVDVAFARGRFMERGECAAARLPSSLNSASAANE